MNTSSRSSTRRCTLLGLCALVALLSLGACRSGGSSASAAADQTKASAAVQSLQQNADVQAAEAKLQAQVQACLKSNTHLMTKAGRDALLNCAVPPSEQASVKLCAKNAIIDAIPFTKAKRDNLEQVALPKCLAAKS